MKSDSYDFGAQKPGDLPPIRISCTGKACFRSQNEARKTIKRIGKRSKGRFYSGMRNGSSTLEPYKCSYCDGWHIGGKKGAKR